MPGARIEIEEVRDSALAKPVKHIPECAADDKPASCGLDTVPRLQQYRHEPAADCQREHDQQPWYRPAEHAEAYPVVPQEYEIEAGKDRHTTCQRLGICRRHRFGRLIEPEGDAPCAQSYEGGSEVNRYRLTPARYQETA